MMILSNAVEGGPVMLFYEVRSPETLVALVEEVGFLPFFRNEIEGFSLEEHTPPELWFAEGVDGPWEWKGPAAMSRRVVYGKLYRNKAGYVSRSWFPVLANLRRDGYDFDARWDDGLALFKDKEVYDTLEKTGPLLSPALKAACGYGKGGARGFDPIITRLQMQTYVCTANFEYAADRYGRPYGWGVARYATPEQLFGSGFMEEAYREDPGVSRDRILAHLRSLLPQAEEKKLRKLIG